MQEGEAGFFGKTEYKRGFRNPSVIIVVWWKEKELMSKGLNGAVDK